jgi:hypothetical protein
MMVPMKEHVAYGIPPVGDVIQTGNKHKSVPKAKIQGKEKLMPKVKMKGGKATK